MRFALTIGLVLAAMLVLDGIWLGTMIGVLYQPNMRSLLSPEVNIPAAVAFYLLYGVGLSYVVIRPLVASGKTIKWTALASRAAVFGLVAYGTYNLTALSVIRDWPMGLSLIDMAWGTIMTSVSAVLAAIGLRLFRQV